MVIRGMRHALSKTRHAVTSSLEMVVDLPDPTALLTPSGENLTLDAHQNLGSRRPDWVEDLDARNFRERA